MLRFPLIRRRIEASYASSFILDIGEFGNAAGLLHGYSNYTLVIHLHARRA